MRTQQKKYPHAAGNNYESVKIYRTRVLLFDEATTGGTQTFGRYYFDEIRELNDKLIVGFNVNIGYDSVLYYADISQTDFTQTTQGQNIGYATRFDLPYFYLNIYNDKKELIVENFPALLAANWNLNQQPNFTLGRHGGTNFIYPLNSKINIKESYFFGNANLTPDNVAISVTFYYI